MEIFLVITDYVPHKYLKLNNSGQQCPEYHLNKTSPATRTEDILMNILPRVLQIPDINYKLFKNISSKLLKTYLLFCTKVNSNFEKIFFFYVIKNFNHGFIPAPVSKKPLLYI